MPGNVLKTFDLVHSNQTEATKKNKKQKNKKKSKTSWIGFQGDHCFNAFPTGHERSRSQSNLGPMSLARRFKPISSSRAHLGGVNNYSTLS